VPTYGNVADMENSAFYSAACWHRK